MTFLNLLINPFYNIFHIYIKMTKHLSAKSYQGNKARLQKEALSKEGKEKKQQYGRKRYKNLSEDEKQRLAEYRKKYFRMEKLSYFNHKMLLFLNNYLESSFDEEYKDILKIQLWSYKFTSES